MMFPHIFNHRLTLLSSLTLLGIFACAPQVLAQDHNAVFNATIPSKCIFSNPIPGTLTADTNTFITAQKATVTITCSGPSTLVVSSPERISGPNLIWVNRSSTATVINGGSTTVIHDSMSARGIGGSPIDNALIEVEMTYEHQDSLIPPGTYVFHVTLTAAPQ